jgi:hypothetical protein
MAAESNVFLILMPLKVISMISKAIYFLIGPIRKNMGDGCINNEQSIKTGLLKVPTPYCLA